MAEGFAGRLGTIPTLGEAGSLRDAPAAIDLAPVSFGLAPRFLLSPSCIDPIAKAGGKAAKRGGKKEQRAIYVTVGSAGGSFGASSLRQEIGLGAAEAIVSVEITWPGDGKPQLVEGVEPRRFYKIRQGQPPRLQELERYELARGPAPEHHHPGH